MAGPMGYNDVTGEVCFPSKPRDGKVERNVVEMKVLEWKT